MNHFVRLLLCLGTVAMLCQCASKEKKKKTKNVAEMTLQERTSRKQDESMFSERSQYEKFITAPKNGKGGTGAYFQRQTANSKGFAGADAYAGQKQFKTDQSPFGKSRSRSADMTYSLGGRQADTSLFKTDQSRLGGMQSRDAASAFGGSGDAFKTGSALTRAKGTPKAPLIIENYNDRKDNKKSAYTEEEVRSLLNRN